MYESNIVRDSEPMAYSDGIVSMTRLQVCMSYVDRLLQVYSYVYDIISVLKMIILLNDLY